MFNHGFILIIIDAEISQTTTVGLSQTPGDSQATINMTVVGVVGALLLILIISLIIILSLIMWYHKRRNKKSEIDPNSGSMREDAPYSTLERGMNHPLEPQASNTTELYDQIHLSPSTGQTELISKIESKTAEGTPLSDVYSSADMENSQPISSSKTEKSKPEDAMYAVVNKNKKKNKSNGASDDNANKNDSINVENSKIKEKRKEEVTAQGQLSLEDMYAVIHKNKDQEETPPPIPASTVESLYTAVHKKPQ